MLLSQVGIHFSYGRHKRNESRRDVNVNQECKTPKIVVSRSYSGINFQHRNNAVFAIIYYFTSLPKSASQQ